LNNKEECIMKKNAIGLILSVLVFLAGASFAEDAASNDMVPVEIVLPEEYLGGTPCDYWSSVLEPYDYRDRPPFLAPKGTTNVALRKPVTSSVPPLHGELKQITDGDKSHARTSLVEIPGGVQWVQVDLQKECAIYAVLVWHFHEGKRVYFDMIMQVSNDPGFKDGVTTVYNNDYDNSSSLGVGEDNEYIETYRGRLVDTKGVSGRYLRLYGNGNTADEFNHFIEIEVYGIPKSS